MASTRRIGFKPTLGPNFSRLSAILGRAIPTTTTPGWTGSGPSYSGEPESKSSARVKMEETRMLKPANSPHNATISWVGAVLLLLPVISAAQAQQAHAKPMSQCKIVGAISHRCYSFHSDATWREGLSDYHGSSGG
jgi:hypothetical protein